jgi:hypothetical protein
MNAKSKFISVTYTGEVAEFRFPKPTPTAAPTFTRKLATLKVVKQKGAAKTETYRKQRITAIVERLSELADRANGVIKEMNTARVGLIEVDGHAMLLRGINQVEHFIENSTTSIREAKNKTSARRIQR